MEKSALSSQKRGTAQTGITTRLFVFRILFGIHGGQKRGTAQTGITTHTQTEYGLSLNAGVRKEALPKRALRHTIEGAMTPALLAECQKRGTAQTGITTTTCIRRSHLRLRGTSEKRHCPNGHYDVGKVACSKGLIVGQKRGTAQTGITT